MQKKQQKQIASLPNLILNRDKSQILSKRYQKDPETSIPSLQEAHKLDKYLVKLHNWRQQSKFYKLQETYDENCRIFISLNKQKSSYQFLKKKSPSKRKAYLKLAPLTERKCLRQNTEDISRFGTKIKEESQEQEIES